MLLVEQFNFLTTKHLLCDNCYGLHTIPTYTYYVLYLEIENH